jgi:uncharacterized protein (TIGR00661 family)
MKILYAVQGTGNGHLARAREIIPYLYPKGKIDILVSGTQSDIDLPYAVKYKLKGLSFVFGKNGGVDLVETYKKSNIKQLYQEIKELPIEKYDVVLNDFEPVSAWACKAKNKTCIGLSHQAAVMNKKSPKPSHIDIIGETILKNYAPVTKSYGFHFKAYDENIFTPIIRKEIRKGLVAKNDHYTVYLPSYSIENIVKVLSQIPSINWHVYSKHTLQEYTIGNVVVKKAGNDDFIKSFLSCQGVLCGAGFETPAEALYLNKKLMVIPMKAQYEQHCNAAALEEMGVPIIPSLKSKYVSILKTWVENDQSIIVDYRDETESLLDFIFEDVTSLPKKVSKNIIESPKKYLLKRFNKIQNKLNFIL